MSQFSLGTIDILLKQHFSDFKRICNYTQDYSVEITLAVVFQTPLI